MRDDARHDLLHSDGTTEQRIAAPLFLNGATQQIALMQSLTSGSILLRRTSNEELLPFGPRDTKLRSLVRQRHELVKEVERTVALRREASPLRWPGSS